MCGCVGVVGLAPAEPVLQEALARMRCGVCQSSALFVNAGPAISDGRARNTYALPHLQLRSQWGLGVTAANAPKGGPNIRASFDGAILNLRPLKRRLVAAGRAEPNATDHDLCAALIALYIERHDDAEAGFLAALDHLQGAFALMCLVTVDDEPVLFGADRGHGLYYASGYGEAALATHPLGLETGLGAAEALEPGDICIVQHGKLIVRDADGMRIERRLDPNAPEESHALGSNTEHLAHQL